jgi:glucose/mannose transport system substrate-binding protein
VKFFLRIFLVFLLVNGLTLASAGADVKSKNRFEIFTWFTAGGEANGMKALASEFRRQNPKSIFFNAAGGDGVNHKGVLVNRLEAGNPPDSFQVHSGAEILPLIQDEKLQDLSSLYKSEGWDKVLPADLIKTLTTDGKIYSVPLKISRTNILWWNPVAAKKAGIAKPPVSLDQMIADMDKFKKVFGLGKKNTSVSSLKKTE